MKNKACPVCRNRGGYHSTDCPKAYKTQGNKGRNRFKSERRNTENDLMFFYRER